MLGKSGCLGQQVMGHPEHRLPCCVCPDGLCRQEMISSIANTGYARWRPSPSLIRDLKSQAEGPNIIYEGELLRRHVFETNSEQAASTAHQREVLPPGLTPSKKGR